MKTLINLLFLLPFTALSQATLSWANYPGGIAIATDASNNSYSVNWDYNPAGDISLTKRDETGNILWETTYDNTNQSQHEVATWVDTDSNGNVIVSGTIRSGYSNPVDVNSLLMKFDASGNLMWRVVYESTFDGSSTRKCLIDANDNIYVLGFGNSGNGMVTQVKKFDPQGLTMWTYFDTLGIGKPVNFKLTPDQTLVISARAIVGSINGFAKIDMNGNALWTKTGFYSLTAGDIAGDSYGNTYLINGEYAPQNTGSIVSKLSPEGNILWEQPTSMAGSKIETGPDSFPVVSGFPSSGAVGAAFLKLDADGNELWFNADADGLQYNLLSHAQLKLDAYGNAYLAASIMTQMAVCKINSDGSQAWTITIPGGYSQALDFGTDFSVFVTGGTTARIMQDDLFTATTENISNDFQINAFPNPFVQEIAITFQLEKQEKVNIWISDLQGRMVSEVYLASFSKGKHTVSLVSGLPGTNNSRFLLLNLQTEDKTISKKLIQSSVTR